MASKADRTRDILRILAQTYPEARIALDYKTTFQLLVAVILSAQCTDKRVNEVTKKLFAEASTPEALAAMDPADLEPKIRACGLGPSKARNIVATSRILMKEHGGQVPGTFESLIALPGVGRKTANVMLANAFGVPAIAVDTHVFRVANRLGLAKASTPEAVEEQLRKCIPQDLWAPAHHWLIHHGREICHARHPGCARCPLLALCPEGKRRCGAS